MNRSESGSVTCGPLFRGAVLSCILLAGLASGASTSGTVAVVVNDGLQPFIGMRLADFVEDLQREGYSVDVRSWHLAGSTPGMLRSHLQALRPGLAGAVLIGDLPVANFEHYDDHAAGSYACFPCDLYYMDLDSTWSDNDGNAVLDAVSPDPQPEIWVSRMTASTFTLLAEADLVNNHLRKNRLYRHGGRPVAQRGLTFIDNDWKSNAQQYNALDAVYTARTKIYAKTQSTATAYMNQLGSGYESIHVAVHSSPTAHTFDGVGRIGNTNIYFADPVSTFSEFFACRVALFTAGDYMAGCYAFSAHNGINVVAATKIGSMMDWNQYFGPMALGNSVGESFRRWFRTHSVPSVYNVAWYYGQTMLGDGTLRIGRFSPPAVMPVVRAVTVDSGIVRVQYTHTVNVDQALSAATFDIENPPGLQVPLTFAGFSYSYSDDSTAIAGLCLKEGTTLRVTVHGLADLAGHAIPEDGIQNVAETRVSRRDNDCDGMSDAWEVRHFGGTNASLGAAIDDWDGDGMNNEAEYVAGTDPTNRLSLFSLSPEFSMEEASPIVLSWPSSSNRTYRLEAGHDLVAGLTNTVATNLAATPPRNTCTVTVDRVGSGFYRVIVEGE